MKRFDYFCDLVRLDPNAKAPDPEYVYYAYKCGEAVAFSTRDEAIAFSSKWERCETAESKQLRKLFYEHTGKLYSDATNLWYAHLKAEYSHMNAEVFNLCYSYAYEKSHAYGHDEIAQTFENIAELIDSVIRVMK